METTAPTFQELLPALPEIVMAGGVLVMLLIGVVAKDATRLVTTLSLLLVAAAALGMFFVPESESVFNGAFVLDPFARFMKIATLIGSGVAILLAMGAAGAPR
jgi:NADH-quinone oxidoreductase subunit N